MQNGAVNDVKHVTFYEDWMTLKTNGQHNNCIAVLRDQRDVLNPQNVIAITPYFLTANSPCVKSEIHRHDLRDHYTKISEQRARHLHPRLFERIARGIEDKHENSDKEGTENISVAA